MWAPSGSAFAGWKRSLAFQLEVHELPYGCDYGFCLHDQNAVVAASL